MRDAPAFLRDVPGRPAPGAARRPAPVRAGPVLAAGSSPVGAPLAGARRIPGEAGLWILLLGDMTVFAVLFGAFLVARADEPALFATGRSGLTTAFGAADTIVLLTSSLCVALAVGAFRAGRARRARRLIAGAGLCAAIFTAFKGLEWGERIHARRHTAHSHFYMYFFVITGIHFLHLLIGAGALALMARTVARAGDGARDRLVVECCASYWHMVDLLWLVIFPLLYLAST